MKKQERKITNLQTNVPRDVRRLAQPDDEDARKCAFLRLAHALLMPADQQAQNVAQVEILVNQYTGLGETGALELLYSLAHHLPVDEAGRVQLPPRPAHTPPQRYC